MPVRKWVPAAPLFILLLLLPGIVLAHVSEQGFVLLLPTRVYIASGVLAVILTVLLLALLPMSVSGKWFSRFRIGISPNAYTLQTLVSLLSLVLLLSLLILGFIGSRDPLRNPLPLAIWTFWWIGLLLVQGVIGDIWRWINPWTGIIRLLGRGDAPPISDEYYRVLKPRRWRFLALVGMWPAALSFLAFIGLLLVDPAPDDPARLAVFVIVYMVYTLLAMCLFGEARWLQCGEFVTILMRRYAQLAAIGRDLRKVDQQDFTATPPPSNAAALYIGMPGWQTVKVTHRSVSAAIFILLMLGCGSFDGLNETFWWLATIGVNPLEFPGRSAVVMETAVGLLLANLLLVLAFALCIAAGNRMVHADLHTDVQDHQIRFTRAFTQFSIAMLPIAFAYHFAHFLTAFMVNIQYVLASASDPLANGADLLGLGQFYVTTGFLNTHHSVEIIWLVQAGVVVVGHMLSVLIAHATAIDLYGSTRRAVLSQLPLASFMILYTFLGLWLLASPKGG